MPKRDPIGVRFSDSEREAMNSASEAKSLSLSALVRMIVVEWLRKHRWLKSK
jgi:hypothetical protein